MSSIVIRVILAGGSLEMPLDDPAALLLGEIKHFLEPEVVLGTECPFGEVEDIPVNRSA